VVARARHKLTHDVVFYPFRAFLALGSLLPLRLARPVGHVVGRVALSLAASDRRRAHEHLAAAFPDLDDDDRRRLLRKTARHLGETLAEIVWLWRASPPSILSRTEVRGFEHLHAAREAGRGVVLVTGHCGNWEWLNAVLGIEQLPMTIAVREVYDPRLNEIARRLRARFGAKVVERGRGAGRALMAALRRNRVVGLLVDQDIRNIPGVFVPFFGRPAWTPAGGAQLALAARCPIVPTFIHRRSDGTHLAEAHPPLPPPSSSDPQEAVLELTAAATAAIEAQVRAHPDQWVWMHRRWRTPPPEPTGVSAI
jgi:KDO2-lipid IV(A) lauroyltransferase